MYIDPLLRPPALVAAFIQTSSAHNQWVSISILVVPSSLPSLRSVGVEFVAVVLLRFPPDTSMCLQFHSDISNLSIF